MSSTNGTYEPLPDDEENLNLKRSTTRRKNPSKRRRGGKAKAALVLGLLVLVLALIALAIALPIVLSRSNTVSPTSQQGRSGSVPSTPSGVAPGSPGVFTPLSFTSPTGWQFPPSSGASPSSPVGPDVNSGSNVFCFRNAQGQQVGGGLLQLGVTDPVTPSQVQVQSCESGNTFFVSQSNLQLCTARCQTPVWQAAQQGLIQPALASQEFICQNGQVFMNARQTQQSFYLKYSAIQPETLVSECTSDNSFWVPNVEMVQCTPEQTSKCNAENLARVIPRGIPIIRAGTPSDVVIHAGPICRVDKATTETWRATGFTRNRLVWWRLKHINEAEVRSCDGTGSVQWIDVTGLSTCSTAAAASCA